MDDCPFNFSLVNINLVVKINNSNPRRLDFVLLQGAEGVLHLDYEGLVDFQDVFLPYNLLITQWKNSIDIVLVALVAAIEAFEMVAPAAAEALVIELRVGSWLQVIKY